MKKITLIKQLKKNFKKILKKLGTYLLFVFLIFMLISTLQVVILKWIDPLTSAVILQRQISLIFSDKKTISFDWYNYDEINSKFALAVIAAEDQNFPFHSGFDLEQIEKAIKERKERGRLRGASTITQQVAKNLFLWEDQSFIRKGFEAYYAILIEAFWGKKRILEIYMNIAETGNNIFGIGNAARIYFHKTPIKLTSEESALIASILPNPVKFSVNKPSVYTRKRQQWILNQMGLLGGTSYTKKLQ